MSQSSLARGGERDALAVRRPGGLRVLEVAVGELLRLGGAVGGDDEDVAATVAGPADVVELERSRVNRRGARFFSSSSS